MAEFVCPRGHLSSEADFCSECGLRIGAAAAPAAGPVAAEAAPAEPCPDCGTPRVAGARFCEVCRHDFSVAAAPRPPAAPLAPTFHSPSPAAVADPSGGIPSPAVASPGEGAEAGGACNLWVLVGRDPDRSEEAPAAAGPERAYPLDLSENLVGRRHGRRDLHPEIPVDDPSVSARHLKICRRPDGTLYGIDVGSSNGTMLNGVALAEGVAAPLRAGDRLAIGAHTLLTLEAR